MATAIRSIGVAAILAFLATNMAQGEPITTTGLFTGGDSGEGLDLDGTFIYAVRFSAETTPTDRTVNGVDFTLPGNTTGLAHNAILSNLDGNPNTAPPVYASPTADDTALAAIMTDWAVKLTGETLSIGLDVQQNTYYKLQLLMNEVYHPSAGNRTFSVDILGDDVNEVTGVDLYGVGAGTKDADPDAGYVITFDNWYSGAVSYFGIDLIASGGGGSDHNPVISALTLEEVPEPSTLAMLGWALLGLGGAASWVRRRRSRS